MCVSSAAAAATAEEEEENLIRSRIFGLTRLFIYLFHSSAREVWFHRQKSWRRCGKDCSESVKRLPSFNSSLRIRNLCWNAPRNGEWSCFCATWKSFCLSGMETTWCIATFSCVISDNKAAVTRRAHFRARVVGLFRSAEKAELKAWTSGRGFDPRSRQSTTVW